MVIILVGFLPALPVAAAPTCNASISPPWQVCGPIEAFTGLDIQPTILQALDGTLSLAWTGNHDANNRLTSNFNVLYATRLANGTWLPASLLTNLGGKNQMPSLAQTSDGTIYLFWSYTATSSNHSSIYYRTFKFNIWSGYNQITFPSSGYNDTGPSATLARDGTLWLAWTRDNSTSSGGTPVFKQLWYKTLSGGVWSSETSLTSSSDINWNWQPSIMVGQDNVVRLAFAKGQPSLSNFQISYMNRTGSGWSSPAPIVSSTSSNVNPSLVQDRNGTIWVFWSRTIPVGTLNDYVVYSKFSTDNGNSWSTEVALTAVSCGTFTCVDSENPAAVQSTTDLKLHVFYATNPSVTGFDIWSLESAAISPVHHVAVTAYSPSSSLQYQGGLASIGQSPLVSVSVTVTNPGDFNETVTLTLTATNTTNYVIGVQNSLILAKGGAKVFIFSWNTTNVKPARYGLSAVLSAIPGMSIGFQTDASLKSTNQIHILPLGDVDQDGSVTITDVTVFFYDYNAVRGVPGSRYNPYCDIVNTGIINIVDIGVVLATYNTFT
jgi:hypothetical protein